jgi:GT2 family glycosyltransferase
MTVSVVIRTRNESARLRLTLASLKGQAGLDEVVVVDDGSTDATAKVIATADLPITHVRHEDAKGRSAASNAGARAARGEVLIFLDGDTLAGPGFAAAHADLQEEGDTIGRGEVWHLRCTRFLLDPETGQPFAEHEARLVRLKAAEREAMRVTAGQIIDNFAEVHRRAQPGIYPGAGPRRLLELEMDALQNHPECPVLWAAASGSNQSVRRESFLAAGGFHPEIDINEHRELALRMVTRGARMRPVIGARSYHLTHRSGWRDPLQDTRWEDLFWSAHPLAEVALLPVLWASLADPSPIPPERRILSLPDLARVAAESEGIQATTAGGFRRALNYPYNLS